MTREMKTSKEIMADKAEEISKKVELEKKKCKKV